MVDNRLIGESEDNNKIIAQVFATRIMKARKERYPTAQDVLDDLAGVKK